MHIHLMLDTTVDTFEQNINGVLKMYKQKIVYLTYGFKPVSTGKNNDFLFVFLYCFAHTSKYNQHASSGIII